jgi:hypothetical protein
LSMILLKPAASPPVVHQDTASTWVTDAVELAELDEQPAATIARTERMAIPRRVTGFTDGTSLT